MYYQATFLSRAQTHWGSLDITGFLLYPLSFVTIATSEFVHECGAVAGLAALALGVAVVLEADGDLARDAQPLLQLATDVHHLQEDSGLSERLED